MSILTDVAAEVSFDERVVTSLSPAATPLCLADPNRFAIGFSVIAGGGTSISTNPATQYGDGWTLDGGKPTWLSLPIHGTLVQAAWFGTKNSPASNITVFEIFVNREK